MTADSVSAQLLATAATPSSASIQRSNSGLRRSATEPSIGSNTSTPKRNDAQGQDAYLFSSSMVFAPMTVLSEEPGTFLVDTPAQTAVDVGGTIGGSYITQVNQFQQINPVVPMLQDDMSPPVLTPALSYYTDSPMSCASTASSDDGERTIQTANFFDMPQVLAQAPYVSNAALNSCSAPSFAGHNASPQRYSAKSLGASGELLGRDTGCRLAPISTALDPAFANSLKSSYSTTAPRDDGMLNYWHGISQVSSSAYTSPL